MNKFSYFILLGHSFIYTIISILILFKQKESINFAFGRKGNELGKVDNSVSKILSKSFALSIISFSTPGLFIAFKKKEVSIMLYPLILYHITPIYLTIKSTEFRSNLSSLYIWHSFWIINIIIALIVKNR